MGFLNPIYIAIILAGIGNSFDILNGVSFGTLKNDVRSMFNQARTTLSGVTDGPTNTALSTLHIQSNSLKQQSNLLQGTSGQEQTLKIIAIAGASTAFVLAFFVGQKIASFK